MTQENKNTNYDTIHTVSDCIQYFHNNIVTPSNLRLGLEYEIILVDKLTTLYVPYFGERSLSKVLQQLMEFNYHKVMDENCIVGLERNNTTISLEPGGQLEFSSSPTISAVEIAVQLNTFLSELYPICERLSIAILHTGYRPFGAAELINTIPRSRYLTLMPHLKKSNAFSNEQKMTASIQVSMDYHSQLHAGKSLALASKCQPFIVALFSNSPIYNGQLSRVKSFRMYTWSKFDPERCGIPDFIFSSDTDSHVFEHYTNWALSRFLLFIIRHDKLISIDGISFYEFLKSGYQGYEPEINDWVVHLGTLFPEARLKNVIEVRSADTCNPKFASGLAAFWKGLIYNEEILQQSQELFEHYSQQNIKQMYVQAYSKGMAAQTTDGKPFSYFVSLLLDFAKKGLESTLDDGKDLMLLDVLQTALKRKQSPADSIIKSLSKNQSPIESMEFCDASLD